MNVIQMMKAWLLMGDIGNDTIEEKIKYKERIVFATMRQLIPQWRKPDDWDNLSNEEKLKRLENLQNIKMPKNER
tara:strand:+ start:203 stop:427 length:225 start_codon:yes stop_codon:yes gene_type:complete